jgi:transcriptional regulator with XRE-family HTH domain
MEVNQRCKAVNNRTPRSRALGNALREARLDRDIGLRQFAKEIGRDPSLVSRWETGDRTPTPTDVAHILGKLGVTGERYDEIIELAYGTDDARWLATTVPEQRAQLAALLDFEATASAIVDVSPLVVPGLLQIGDYARVIMVEGGAPVDEISTRVTIRLGRREVLRRAGLVPLQVLVGEAALRQLIGTRQIMAAQLAFLLEIAEWPNVDIRVVPFDTGWHPGLVGPFLLIESETQPPVVNLELQQSSLFLHTRTDVATYRRSADTVATRAMNAEDSLALIALVKAGWESA